MDNEKEVHRLSTKARVTHLNTEEQLRFQTARANTLDKYMKQANNTAEKALEALETNAEHTRMMLESYRLVHRELERVTHIMHEHGIYDDSDLEDINT